MSFNTDKTDKKINASRESLESPLVSVVIPCLNRADFLIPTLESVLQQDYPNIECIVMDGGSTDGTTDILCRYDGRIEWKSQPDRGPSDAINKGWWLLGGEILAWLNADDVWAPAAVSKAVAYFQEHPDVDVVYGDCGIIDEHGKRTITMNVRDWNLRHAVEHCDHIIFQAASFMRRSILERVGWLWPKLCHDHELWLRISRAGGRLQRMPTLLAYARNHAGNLGYCSDLVIPLKLEITKKFFSDPGVPQEVRGLRHRSISNAYLRGMEYVIWRDLRWSHDVPNSLGLLAKALNADPSNILAAMKHLCRLADRMAAIFARRYLPHSVYQKLKAAKRRLLEKVSFGSTGGARDTL